MPEKKTIEAEFINEKAPPATTEAERARGLPSTEQMLAELATLPALFAQGVLDKVQPHLPKGEALAREAKTAGENAGAWLVGFVKSDRPILPRNGAR